MSGGSIYLAARYSRREELCEYREQLQALGYVVTSRWLNGEHQAVDDDPGEMATQLARDDLGDLGEATTVVCFTEAPRSGHSRGGRHVEFGVALGVLLVQQALDEQLHRRNPDRYRIIAVGPRENVFYWLPEVEHYDTWDEAYAALARSAGTS